MSSAAPPSAVPHLREHFSNLEQQQSTVNLGMWFFLATEVLFFWWTLSQLYRLPNELS